MCTKCHGKGKLYQIDGSVASIKPCDCDIAKEQQANVHKWIEQFRLKLATLQKEG